MPTQLFDWAASASWLADIPDYAASILTPRVEAKIARVNPECWCDDFSWLPVEEGELQFFHAFAGHYQHIRAFHGCRPTDLNSYFEYGLQGQSAETIEAQFLSIFGDVPESKLQHALAEFSDRKESERGRFWVVLAESELVESCGHYLIQGSEYLMALAATLCRVAPGEDYRLRLRSIGTPTIFELHIPTGHFPERQVRALSKLVLAAWGEHVAKRPMGRGGVPCLTVRRTVEPKHLVRHTHPACIRDPLFGHAMYVNERTTCTHCAG